MRRGLYDIPRWHAYLHRTERWLPLSSALDQELLKVIGDEVFAQLYARDGDIEPVVDPNDKLAVQAAAVYEFIAQKYDLKKLAAKCRGNVVKAAETTHEVLQFAESVMHPEPDEEKGDEEDPEDSSTGQEQQSSEQRDDAEDIEEGLEDVEQEDESDGGDRGKEETEEMMQAVGRLASKMKRSLGGQQRLKVKHGADEVVDVEQGDDLSRLLPTEMLRLASKHRMVRLAAMRDLIEKKCLQYQMQSTQPAGRGPLVLCRDVSGSMKGAREIWAAAVTLALIDMAHRQDRTFILLNYEWEVPENERARVVVRPGEKILKAALFYPSRGNTRVMPVLDLALRAVESSKLMKKADVVLLNDGGQVSTKYAPEIRERAKKRDVNMLAIGVGRDVQGEDLKPWCDEVCLVDDVSGGLKGLDDRVVESLFSL